ncbi:Lipoprotein-releasing system ATP-binding protein LolD [Calycomorphotria hydatis]|uniref:Lipoprotein-releasing system ATP-binding protein LolD n=2 Tax=Calycomorphotria hydatis TaxID=2528027 RepID=A0A517T598_9PLAN|nr:Lipoprotein-releasing system ATP-binding protein LolD [Calycomorphotria hydatis]
MKTHHRGSTEVPALRGVTGAIPEGSFTFILGPSGSGKSTLLHLVGTLDSPTSGEILVGGESLGMMTSRSRDLYRRDRVGFIFQSFNLLKNLSALDNVLVPFLPRGVSNETRKRAFALLKKVGLGERIDHTPNELSGGEQQRVAIARALLKNPSLILADEPTGELDSVTGAEIISALRELQQEIKATVVIVTHDESLIEPSDHVLRMRDGKLL